MANPARVSFGPTLSRITLARLRPSLMAIIGLLCAQIAVAQTALSNVGQPTAGGNYGIGSYSISINVGDAVSFTTGAASVDFTGVTFLLAASGTAQGSGFHVTLNSGFSSPGGTTGILATLAGNSSPAPGGTPTTFAYTATIPVTLAANTTYWVQVDAFTTPTGTHWNWAQTDTSPVVDAGGLTGWSFGITSFAFTNTGGSSWSFNTPGPEFPQFSVQYQATAVPEPSVYATLAGLAALGFAAIRRRSAH